MWECRCEEFASTQTLLYLPEPDAPVLTDPVASMISFASTIGILYIYIPSTSSDLRGPFAVAFVGWQMLHALSLMHLRTPVVVLGRWCEW